MLVKVAFHTLVRKFVSDTLLADSLWAEIETKYSQQGRHYHTTSHLEHMLSELLQVQSKIRDWDTILFALVYHDIVYNPTSHHNEEKSAEVAEARLIQIHYPPAQIHNCKEIILATKTHIESTDEDINYFIDADLCILGQSWEQYSIYTKNIRKEYSIYPDFIYKPGRKKVVNHFLGMRRIFKTDFFFAKFEERAKENLARELNLL